MKVFLLQDIENVGISHEIVKVSDGYAQNFLLPRKLAVVVDEHNEQSLAKRAKVIEKRHEVIATKSSMLAERIKSMNLTLKRKMHDDGKLYGSVNPVEIADLLAEHGVSVSKSQVELDKSIKAKGIYEVTIKLSSRLQPKVSLNIVPE